MVTRDRLKEVLFYSEETGLFSWKVSKNSFGGKVAPGITAGSRQSRKKGYIRIVIDGEREYAHRLAFLYVYGWIPKVIDHINGNKSDNRISNLRPSTHFDNAKNRAVSVRNKSGVSGVTYTSRDAAWISMIKDGKSIHRKQFKDFFEAVCWRKSLECKTGVAGMSMERA